MPKLFPPCVAEFLGTFMLVFFGCGSIIISTGVIGGHPVAPPPISGLVTIALAHGLILSIMVTACMYISGAQFNPAVSIGLVVCGKQPIAKAVLFIAVQLAAAACAAGLLQVLLTPEVANGEGPRLGATIGMLTTEGQEFAVLGIEAVLTFALMWSILAGTVDGRAHKLGGFTIGLTVAACILAAGPLTGASMNPARTFGPAVCGDHWDMHWVYWAGPVLGAGVAALLYKLFWTEEQA